MKRLLLFILIATVSSSYANSSQFELFKCANLENETDKLFEGEVFVNYDQYIRFLDDNIASRIQASFIFDVNDSNRFSIIESLDFTNNENGISVETMFNSRFFDMDVKVEFKEISESLYSLTIENSDEDLKIPFYCVERHYYPQLLEYLRSTVNSDI